MQSVLLVMTDMDSISPKKRFDIVFLSFRFRHNVLLCLQVEEIVKPSNESIVAVNQWLSKNEISAQTISPTGDWLKFTVPVSKASELFDADFHLFTHEKTGKQVIRTMSYSVPEDLKGHLDLVHPTVT